MRAMRQRDGLFAAKQQLAANSANTDSVLNEISGKTVQRGNRRGYVQKLILLCLFLASPAFADEAVLIDCEHFSTYLNSLATLRDEGKSEDEVLAAIDKTFDPRI